MQQGLSRFTIAGGVQLSPLQIERFWAKVDRTASGCWMWMGAKSRPPNGTHWYGVYSVTISYRRRKSFKAHRFSHMITKGDPGNLDVLHHCDTPLCVRPDHLYAGTPADNARDMRARGRERGMAYNNRVKTICKRGHPLSGDNLRINPRGQRVCKACACILTREYEERKSAINQTGDQ